MKKYFERLLIVIVFLIVLVTVFTVVSYFVLKSSVPNYQGEERVNGISSRTEILTDSLGIPLINAENELDAIYALGYLHAKERMFQMDIARRAGEGRLSEVLGEKTIPFDKMFRTIGLNRVVKRDYPRIDSSTRVYLELYAKGVNAYLENNNGNVGLEFDLLGYKPEKWKPEHSLIIGKLLAWELNISWWTDITYSILAEKFGADKLKEILPDFPENGPFIINGVQVPKEALSFVHTDRNFRKFMGEVGTHIGSNNWVVSSAKSNSGKPMIANDPHLAFSAPGKWYFAIIRSKELNVEGFTLPGVPAVVIGKNKDISWAVTNVMSDDADFYIEKLDSTGNNYVVDGVSKQFTEITDTIFIKDSKTETIKIKSTYRGPIINSVHLYNQLYPSSKVNNLISMRWVALDYTNELGSMIALNKARNWDEFKEGLRNFNVPGQNFVYADRFDNIGYVCAAKLPTRRTNSPTMVYDGTTSANDWTGFITYEEMPKLFNPSENYIATANNKVDTNFPYHISNIWEPSSRIDRIIELLISKKEHSVKDFKLYQNDVISPYARNITLHIINAFEGINIKDKNLKETIKLLKVWQFDFTTNNQIPSIYTRFMEKLIQNIFLDEMGDGLLREFVFVANIPYRVLSDLLKKNNSIWFDNIKTEEIETGDYIIRKSLVDALSSLEAEYGKDISRWQWGSIHKLTIKHFFSGQSSLLDKLINIGPNEMGGDGTTIFNTEYSFSELPYDRSKEYSNRSKPYETVLGPSMRFIFDYSEPDYIYISMPTGEAGNFFSPYYKNMTSNWLKGKYYKLPINYELFRSNAKFNFKLIPK
ncbi:MAG: penicillin acylase family protein [Melioribacteraceae bacterium]|nr:penicillin acylase family protein [Melioribacteraceae bacterium]